MNMDETKDITVNDLKKDERKLWLEEIEDLRNYSETRITALSKRVARIERARMLPSMTEDEKMMASLAGALILMSVLPIVVDLIRGWVKD